MSEAIISSFNDAVFFHTFFALFCALPVVFNIINLFSIKSDYGIVKKLFYTMPLLFFTQAVNLCSGAFIIAMSISNHSFAPSIYVIYMLVVSLAMIGAEVYRVRRFSVARRTSREAFTSYIAFCRVLYIIEALALASIYAIYYFRH